MFVVDELAASTAGAEQAVQLGEELTLLVPPARKAPVHLGRGDLGDDVDLVSGFEKRWGLRGVVQGRAG